MSLLRFLCFNIHGGRSLDGKRDLSRVHTLMEKLNIDIGVFQEMETRESKGGTFTDVNELAGAARPYHFPGPTLKEGKGWYGNLIVSRYPIARALAHTMETKPSLEPRNAIDTLIKTPWGNIRVIGTHLSLSPLERHSEVKKLMELVDKVEGEEKNPVFLMGDINEWRRGSKLIRHLDSILIPLSCAATFPAFWPLLKLDRAWHDTARIRASARALTGPGIRSLSDHLPLLVEVESFGQDNVLQ